MNKLSAGIIGLGSMGKNHLRVLKSIPEVEVTAIFDSNSLQIGTNSEISLSNSIEDFFRNKFDYVVVATPTNNHEDYAIRALDAGSSILIEKPIAMTYASASRIVNHAKLLKKEISVGHIEKFNAASIEAKQKIQDGILGTILQISTRRIGPHPHRISDVGVTLDLCSHDIQLTMWLLGKRYKNVFAVTKSINRLGNEDLIMASGILEDQIIFNHTVNWVSPTKERSITILGEKGSLVIDTLQSNLTFFESGGNVVSNPQLSLHTGYSQGESRSFAFDKPEPLLTEHLSFINYLNGQKSEIVTGEMALETVRVCEAFIQSARDSRVIEV